VSVLSDPWEVFEADFPKTRDAGEKLRFLLNYAVLAPLRAQHPALAVQG
jgi:hypothetical protein